MNRVYKQREGISRGLWEIGLNSIYIGYYINRGSVHKKGNDDSQQGELVSMRMEPKLHSDDHQSVSPAGKTKGPFRMDAGRRTARADHLSCVRDWAA